MIFKNVYVIVLWTKVAFSIGRVKEDIYIHVTLLQHLDMSRCLLGHLGSGRSVGIEDWLLCYACSGQGRHMEQMLKNMNDENKGEAWFQCLSQDLETGYLKLAVVKSLGVQIFKGDHNIL